MFSILTILLMFYFCKNNIITLLISIEMLLLTVTLKFIYLGGYLNDISPTMFALLIIILAGAESAIGLSLLVSYYKLRGRITHIL
ncbi:NADH dehydrogenase subunit 4L (mitochondrion) [Australozyma saopauloensis]|uniref:NADH-ubiquinone oxidoreductase chain 4L n=1 Tax=Australozyma saopauloensis TaxID=291208 RepID=A0AAX4HHN5_9ASCO|nr:NADH dehydrogenase subunit 4L [[Candida] saopauloensis]